MRRNPYGFAFVRRTSPLLRETPTLMGAGVAGNAPTCPLLFLRESLYLISFLSVTEKMLTPHFLRHYTSRVGIKAEHIRLLLHLPCRSCHNRTATFLKGLAEYPIHIHSRHDQPDAGGRLDALVGKPQRAARLRVRLVNVTYSERLRLDLINAEIARLPRDAWVIVADVDEFFQFPCSLELMMRTRRDELYCAEMQDRLAMSGQITPIAAYPSLEEQYPLACYLRQHYWQHVPQPPLSKIVLMKAFAAAAGQPRALLDSHHLTTFKRWGMRCRALGYFHHYTLTREALQTLVSIKLDRRHQYAKDPASNDLYATTRRFLEAHREHTAARRPRSDAREHAWCQLPARPALYNVTWFTNQLLTHCKANLTLLGGVRAV